MSDEIRKGIKRLVATEPENQAAEVLSVDKQKLTCTVRLIRADVKAYKVRLSVDGIVGMVLFPKVGSSVLVSQVDGERDYVVTGVGELEEAWFNNKEHDSGQAIVPYLFERLRKIEDAFIKHKHGVPGPTTTPPDTAATIGITMRPQLENKKFMH